MNLNELIEVLMVLAIDLLFLSILALVTVGVLFLPKLRFRHAAFAVAQRNFVGYFSNPTGYVFLCLFCVLAAVAAFWPHEFFTSNLANFDQLNVYLPYIMLIFIPAITMAIWAEEKRQGTDELLLTLPATDFDVVLGKYLAALYVFTVSLVFSEVCNYWFLAYITEGNLDSGLLSATYLGYWFVGMAMISLGMVASFLTNNLTVGFIFGAVFNAPLAFLSNVDVVVSGNELVSELSSWGYLSKFEAFGRGVIAIVPMVYFIGIAVIGIYLSLVLIGRRHWIGGRDGSSTIWHFVVRVPMLLISVIAASLFVQNSGLNRILRYDASEEKVSSLKAQTTSILNDINQKEGEYDEVNSQIVIDAFIGNNIPPKYSRTRFEVISLLKEFATLGDQRIRLNLNQGIDPVSEEAVVARKSFGIRPFQIESNSRGSNRRDQVILGASITCGLERVTIPFFYEGMNVEYELIRAIQTVAKPKRKTVGVLTTYAVPAGGLVPTQQGYARVAKSEYVKSIEKQYKVEAVAATEPIRVWTEEDGEKKLRYDVLLVVQPSSLPPEQLLYLMDAIKQGQPTAIFEDPFAIYDPRTRNPYMNEAGGCDIQALWNLLGIVIDQDGTGRDFLGRGGKLPATVAWQQYNPYPSLDEFTLEWEALFFSNAAPGASTWGINQDNEITSGLNEIFAHTAAVVNAPEHPTLGIDVLLAVGTQSGTTPVVAFYDKSRSVQQSRKSVQDPKPKACAVQVTGEISASQKKLMGVGMRGSDYKPPTDLDYNINVVYVGDTDIISDYCFRKCYQPEYKNTELRFQNDAFGMNVIDSLAKANELISVRQKEQKHKTLRRIESQTFEFKKLVIEATSRAKKKFDEAKAKEDAKYNDLLRRLNQLEEKNDPESNSQAELLKIQVDSSKRDLNVKTEILNREKEEEISEAENQKELSIRRIQSTFRWYSAIVPIIFPSILGLAVFAWRRMREREGMSKARIRK